MIKVVVTKIRKKQVIMTHPCLVKGFGNIYMTLPINKDTAYKYDNWERDAIVISSISLKEPVGTYIKALNLEECEVYDGVITMENEKTLTS